MNKATNVLEYKGYHTKIKYDVGTCTLYGVVEGIADFVNFECEDMKNVEKEFHEAVDDYLDFCKEIGKEPEKEYRGVFNVRVKPEIHKKLVLLASKRDITLNALVEDACKTYLSL